ncbi:hypothetical protein D5086_018573 [Populus alba]|uniref:Uncharacterized protein n=1 Tax=Populus alba TaxID=43335 RepID=A0ACC4BQ14_POPAL
MQGLHDTKRLMQEAGRQEALECGVVKRSTHESSHGFVSNLTIKHTGDDSALVFGLVKSDMHGYIARDPLLHVASGAEALARGLVKKLAHEPSHGCLLPNHQEYRSDWPLFISVKHHDPTASTNYLDRSAISSIEPESGSKEPQSTGNEKRYRPAGTCVVQKTVSQERHFSETTSIAVMARVSIRNTFHLPLIRCTNFRYHAACPAFGLHRHLQQRSKGQPYRGGTYGMKSLKSSVVTADLSGN